ncbi:hypothetical protein NDN08_008269 [Rhodosorus marinus]|uniref:Glucan 1,4-alpha-glucosidase n=1 Tax=Rhodosorus marinus TaxID=101924 RepID=A0AAV8UZX2_9RHOD|nr:hypothetical protein NDN08_008269 [Rhodosorus marinus]
MPRDIPVGNQTSDDDPDSPCLLVNFRTDYSFGEVYYPRVGTDNHTGGARWRLGVFVETRGFAWLDGPDVKRTLDYAENELVTKVSCEIPSIKVTVECEDFVDSTLPVFVRTCKIYDNDALRSTGPLVAKLFFFATPCMGAREGGNTATYDPDINGVLCFNRDRYMLITGSSGSLEKFAVDDYTVKWRAEEDLVRRLCETGRLDKDAVRHGTVETAVQINVDPKTRAASLVLVFGRSENELNATLDDALTTGGITNLRNRTRQHWRRWMSSRLKAGFAADLRPEASRLYNRSLLVVRTHCDNGGAILAAVDWSVHADQKESYSYCWMRDAGLCAESLSRNKCPEIAERLFRFGLRIVENAKKPFFYQKYCSDGTVGSGWMGRIDQLTGRPTLPIQQDETAILLWAVGRHHDLHPQFDSTRVNIVRHLVFPAADWMCEWRLPCGLPRPSTDLWEERFGVHLHTVVCVWAALSEASKLANQFEDPARVFRYESALDEIRHAVAEYFPLMECGWVPRMRHVEGDEIAPFVDDDRVLDAASAAMFQMGFPEGRQSLFPLKHVESTMEAVRRLLWIEKGVGGVARYQDDQFQLQSDVEYEPGITGNPWIICTLWLAEYDIWMAKKQSDLLEAREAFNWVVDHAALESGILAEQVHPTTGEPLSVSPLAWSHTTYLSVVHKFETKRRSLEEVKRGAQVRKVSSASQITMNTSF